MKTSVPQQLNVFDSKLQRPCFNLKRKETILRHKSNSPRPNGKVMSRNNFLKQNIKQQRQQHLPNKALPGPLCARCIRSSVHTIFEGKMCCHIVTSQNLFLIPLDWLVHRAFPTLAIEMLSRCEFYNAQPISFCFASREMSSISKQFIPG